MVINMNKKHTQECFKPHTILHSLFGFGLGVLFTTLFGVYGMTGVVTGVSAIVIAFALDYRMGRRK